MNGKNSYHRVRYRERQLLTVSDLQSAVDCESRLQGLHVRAVHNTWGVALGFDVTVDKANMVWVGPGIAYDCFGNQIISAREFPLVLPSIPQNRPGAAWWFDLTISYKTTKEFPNKRDLSVDCLGVGINPLEEQPVWHWHMAGEAPNPYESPAEVAEGVCLGKEVPLARFRIMTGGKVSSFDFKMRRNAQGLVRPHIASGRVLKGAIEITGSIWDWSAEITTSAGGLSRDKPAYFVSLVDHPFSENSGFETCFENDKPSKLFREALGPFVSIQSPSRNGFTLNVRMALPPSKDWPPGLQPTDGLTLPVAVDWIGVEPSGGCPPALSSNFINSLSLLQTVAISGSVSALPFQPIIMQFLVSGGSIRNE